MPAAVLSPTVATLPASSTAWPIGSLAPVLAGGAGRGRGGVLRAVDVVRFAVVRVLRFALVLDVDADADLRAVRAVEPLLRLALRCPGRDRGRLPRTPGFSSFAGTSGKIAVAAA